MDDDTGNEVGQGKWTGGRCHLEDSRHLQGVGLSSKGHIPCGCGWIHGGLALGYRK